jgi:hypothetical protein
MSDLITPENSHEFDRLPGGAFLQLYVPMICPDCSDIHRIPVSATVIPKDGGLARLVHMVQEHLIQQGFRIPSQEDFQAALERMEAEEKERAAQTEAMKTAEARAKERGAFFINRTPNPKGDA